MHFFGREASSVQLRVGAPVSVTLRQRSGGFHKPAVSGSAPETAIASSNFKLRLASLFPPPFKSVADFPCKKVVPGQDRREAPIRCAPANSSRSPSLCRQPPRHDVESVVLVAVRKHQRRILPRAPFRPASIKVMQRTFNPWNRARYPGGPPIHCRVV